MPSLVCFLNNVDLVGDEDEDLIELVEMEIRGMLTFFSSPLLLLVGRFCSCGKVTLLSPFFLQSSSVSTSSPAMRFLSSVDLLW